MKTKMISWWPCWLAVFAMLAMAGCTEDGQGGLSGNPEYPPAQQAFYALNKACLDAYSHGQNEIQKSMAFNDCNQKRSQFSSRQQIANWTGTIADISTDQGADVVTVDIEAEVDGFEMKFMTVNNRFSDMDTHSMITRDNPLFNALANMKEGDKVSFDARFLQHPEGKRGLWEGSMTEEGSMSEPEFNVKFSDIRRFGSTPVANVAQSAAPAVAPTQTMAAASSAKSDVGAGVDSQDCDSRYEAYESAEMTPDALARFEAQCPDQVARYSAILRNASREMDEGEAKPSFDCAKASTRSEQLICSDADLASLDRALSHAYAAALSKVADKAVLRTEQKQWVKEVRDVCGDLPCMSNAYRERLAHMQSL